MSQFMMNVMTRGENFSSASFAYSPPEAPCAVSCSAVSCSAVSCSAGSYSAGENPSLQTPGEIRQPEDRLTPGEIRQPEDWLTPGEIGQPEDWLTPGEIGQPENRLTPGEIGQPEDWLTPGEIGQPENRLTPGEIGQPEDWLTPDEIGQPENRLTPGEIGDLAVRALLEEVHTTPKPGLVDLANNGSHTDMDFRSFVVSASALRHCFEQCAQAGMTFPDNLPVLAVTLRHIGLKGERSMYGATGGVNTHKGAIFSMGILCAAAAMGSETLDALQENCKAIAAALLDKDAASDTHGLAVRQTTGIGGIRTEAMTGFDSAFTTGLPAMEDALAAGRSQNDAMIYALLRIMASSEDSNLVHRGGVEGMDFAQKEARRLTEQGPEALDISEVRRLDEEFITRNLSPGGSADLLAFSAMLCFLKTLDCFQN